MTYLFCLPDIVASASLYSFECRTIEDAIAEGRTFARKHGRTFEGMKLDIDAEGGIHIHIIGVDSFRL
jgi:hypothetical protein